MVSSWARETLSSGPYPDRSAPMRGRGLRAAESEEPPLAFVVDLERGVLDPEAAFDEHLELAPDGVAVVAGTDEDVRGESGEAGADRPHVEVVDVRDLRVLGDGEADLVHAHSLRCGLE